MVVTCFRSYNDMALFSYRYSGSCHFTTCVELALSSIQVVDFHSTIYRSSKHACVLILDPLVLLAESLTSDEVSSEVSWCNILWHQIS